MQPLAVLALAGAASASLIEHRQTPKGACATGVHTIAIGGSNSPDEYSLGLLSTLATNITAAIPGSDYVSLPYDKVQPTPNTLAPGAISGGITLLGQYVSQYHAACPDTKIAVIGYSSGAVISSVATCTEFTVPQSLAGNTIIANIWYGVETYNPGQSYDLGTCVSGSGNQPLPDPAACGAYIPLTQSYCDFNDPQCCDGPQSDFEIHFVYPSKYDLQATNFVVSQFQSAGGSVSSSSSSSGAKTHAATHSAASATTPATTAIVTPSSSAKVSPISSVISTMSFPSNSSTSAASSSAPISSATSPIPTANAAATTPVTATGSALLNAAFIGALAFLGATLL